MEAFNSGKAYLDLKYWDDAIQEFTKAIQLEPKMAEAYVYRGCAYREKKEYAAAISDFSVAIALDPSDPFPFIRVVIFMNESASTKKLWQTILGSLS